MTVDEPEPAKPIEFTVHPVAEGDVVVTEENCPPRVEDWERQNRAVAAASYYARRSARDPEWREAQLAEVKERERRRREQDPETFLAARREIARRYRERRRTDPVWRAKQTEAEGERRAGFSEEERARASRAAVERKRRRRSLAARGLTERAGTTYIPTYIGGGITRLAGASESRMRLLRKAQLTRGFSRSRTELASAHGGS